MPGIIHVFWTQINIHRVRITEPDCDERELWNRWISTGVQEGEEAVGESKCGCVPLCCHGHPV